MGEGLMLDLTSKRASRVDAFLALLRDAFGIFNTLGLVLGAVSIFYLGSKLMHMDLKSFIADWIKTYRWLVHDIAFGPIWALLKVQVPEWASDVGALWVAMTSVAVRTLSSARNQYRIAKNGNGIDGIELGTLEEQQFNSSAFSFYALTYVVAALFWPFLFIRFWYSDRVTNFVRYDSADVKFRKYRKIWLIQMTALILAVAALIATNAGLPNPS